MALLLERSYTGERTYTRLKQLVSHIVPAGQPFDCPVYVVEGEEDDETDARTPEQSRSRPDALFDSESEQDIDFSPRRKAPVLDSRLRVVLPPEIVFKVLEFAKVPDMKRTLSTLKNASIVCKL
ncbi:hypothetical protein JCM16303_001122 [Sporobolomyces ruberrimus]